MIHKIHDCKVQQWYNWLRRCDQFKPTQGASPKTAVVSAFTYVTGGIFDHFMDERVEYYSGIKRFPSAFLLSTSEDHMENLLETDHNRTKK